MSSIMSTSLSNAVREAVSQWIKQPVDTSEFEVRFSSRDESYFTNFDPMSQDTTAVLRRMAVFFQQKLAGGGYFSRKDTESQIDTIIGDDKASTRIEWEGGMTPLKMTSAERKRKVFRKDASNYGLRLDVSTESPITDDPRNHISIAALTTSPQVSTRTKKRISWTHPSGEYKIDVTTSKHYKLPNVYGQDESGFGASSFDMPLVIKGGNVHIPPGMSKFFIDGHTRSLQERGLPITVPTSIRLKDHVTLMLHPTLTDFPVEKEEIIVEVEFLSHLRRTEKDHVDNISRKVFSTIWTMMNLLQDSFVPLRVGEIQAVLRTIEGLIPKKYGRNPLRPQQPRNMKANSLSAVIRNPYAFTIKADGQERFLVSLSTRNISGIYLFDRKGTLQKISGQPLIEKLNHIVQGELINLVHPNGKQSTEFHVFDVLYESDKDVRSLHLVSRVSIFQSSIQDFDTKSLPFSLYVKEYFSSGNVCQDTKSVLAKRTLIREATEKARREKTSYPPGVIPEDGIVMTYDGEYDHSKHPPYKLKPADENTIDFQLVYNPQRSTGQSLAYDLVVSNIDRKTKETIRQVFRGTRDYPADSIVQTSTSRPYHNGGIYEVKYHPRAKTFQVVRERTDKNFPNRMPTVLSIWEDIHVPFSFDDFVTGVCSREGAEDIIGSTKLANTTLMESISPKSLGWIGLWNGSGLVNLRNKPNTFVYGIPLPTDTPERIRRSAESFDIMNRFIYLSSGSIVQLPSTVPRDIIKYRKVASGKKTKEMSPLIDQVFSNMTISSFFSTQMDFLALIRLVHTILAPGGKFTVVFLDGERLLRGFLNRPTIKEVKSSHNSFAIERKFEFNSKIPDYVIARSIAEKRPLTDEDHALAVIEPPTSKFGLEISVRLGKRAPIVENMVFGSAIAQSMDRLKYNHSTKTSFLQLIDDVQRSFLSDDDKMFLDMHTVWTFEKPGSLAPRDNEPLNPAFDMTELKSPKAKPLSKSKTKSKLKTRDYSAVAPPTHLYGDKPSSTPPKKTPKKPSKKTKSITSSAAGLDELLEFIQSGPDDETIKDIHREHIKQKHAVKPLIEFPEPLPGSIGPLEILRPGQREVIRGRLPFLIPPKSKLVRIGVSPEGSCFYHALLRLVEPKYQKVKTSAERRDLVDKFRKQLSDTLNVPEFMALAGGSVAHSVLLELAESSGVSTPDMIHMNPTLLEGKLEQLLGKDAVMAQIQASLQNIRKSLEDASVWFDGLLLPYILNRVNVNVFVLDADTLKPRVIPRSDCAAMYPRSKMGVFILNLDNIHFEPLVIQLDNGTDVSKFNPSHATYSQIYELACPGTQGSGYVPAPIPTF